MTGFTSARGVCFENGGMSSGTTYSLASQIAAQIEEFLVETPEAVVLEDGAILFDFSTAQYSVAPEPDKCVLQIWSEERNIVRRVVGSERKNGALRLQVMRFGHSKPAILELCAGGDRRAPSSRRVARAHFQRLIERVVARNFPGWTPGRFATSADLEHSFGAAYSRGWVRLGPRYFAVVGVSPAEPQAVVDALPSMAILWLNHCRERFAARGHVEGVCLCAPAGRTDVMRLRLAHLDRELAKWRLLEIESRSESCEEIDSSDAGNFATRLVRCPERELVLERLRDAIDRVRDIVPQAQTVVTSSSELSFRLLGLEFARATLGATHGFRVGQRIVFGAGAAAIELNDATEPLFREMAERLLATRYRRDRNHPLFRTGAERWLESMVQRDVSLLDDRLDPSCVYAQVPAFASTDRAMIDLLSVTRQGRLAVIELKADEDLHLPLQGLDYWARVLRHHQRGEFQANGYFPGRELSPEPPLLIMAAPALHLHPSTDVLLKALDPQIDWTLLGLDERWRDGVKVIFRKHAVC